MTNHDHYVDRPLTDCIPEERQEFLDEMYSILRKSYQRLILKLIRKQVKDFSVTDCEKILLNKKAFIKDFQALLSKYLG